MDLIIESNIIQNEMMVDDLKAKRHNDMIGTKYNSVRNSRNTFIEKHINLQEDSLSDNSEAIVCHPEPEDLPTNRESKSDQNKQEISKPLRSTLPPPQLQSTWTCCIIL